MFKNTPQTRTLERAFKICGGAVGLAEALMVTVDDLARWRSGLNATPDPVYLLALDVVAAGRRR